MTAQERRTLIVDCLTFAPGLLLAHRDRCRYPDFASAFRALRKSADHRQEPATTRMTQSGSGVSQAADSVFALMDIQWIDPPASADPQSALSAIAFLIVARRPLGRIR